MDMAKGDRRGQIFVDLTQIGSGRSRARLERVEVPQTIIIARPDRVDAEYSAQDLLRLSKRKCHDLPVAFKSS